MTDDRLAGATEVLVRVTHAQRRGRLDVETGRHVARKRVVRSRLVGDEIERLTTPRQLRHDLGGVAEQADRERTALARRGPHTLQRLFQRFGSLVQVTRIEPPQDPLGVDLDAQDRRTCKRRGQRLRAAHPAEARGQNRPTREVGGAEVLLTGSHERLVGALQDALAADVDPASSSHLAEHRQAERLKSAELVPGGPARDEQRVRDQDARSSGARPEDSDRLTALNEHRLVVAERQQRADERAQRLGIPRRLSRAAVDDELLGPLGDLRVEIVQQHSQRRLRRPRARVQLGAARRTDRREVAAERLNRLVDRPGGTQSFCSACLCCARKRHQV
jgi:hypothetical protein